MSKTLLSLLILLLCTFTLSAQTLESHTGAVKSAYNFWIYKPAKEGKVQVSIEDSTMGERKPLIVFLHGASLCGRDLKRVRKYGPLDAVKKGLRLGAYILAPQNPGGSWDPKKIIQLVDWTEQHLPIDTTRIYVVGMSLGGFGTIDFTAAFPDRIAAAMALCGGGTKYDAAGLCKVPLAIIHGTGDKAVSWSASQKVVDAMRSTGPTQRLLFYKLPGRTHGDLARYFYLPEVYQWLFSHSLKDSLRSVCRDFTFDYSVLKNVYKKIDVPSDTLSVEHHSTDGSNVAALPEKETTEASGGVHKVRQGDTLSGIAKRYHTTVNRLCQLNSIKATSMLRLGQKIKY